MARGGSYVQFGTGGTSVTGEAAYTAVNCGMDACPFYLAQFDLSQSSGWTTTVSFPGTTPTSLTKQASAVELSLWRPGLGIWLPASGWVIFPPNSLMLRGEAVVSGSSNAFSENGRYDGVAVNDEYVFGLVTFGPNSNTFLIGANGTNIFGSWGVLGEFSRP